MCSEESPTFEIFSQRDLAEPFEITCAAGTAVFYTHRSPDKSSCNQDTIGFVVCPGGAVVLIVADGVGGEAFGEKASLLAADTVAKTVCQAWPAEDLRPAILDGIEHANRAVLQLGTDSATTLAVVEIRNQNMRGYHVGDSMTLVFGSRGALKWRSVAHSPIGYAVESGLLEEDEAMFHEDRHLVSNLVGTEDMHIEVGPVIPLTGRDTVLLASDGLFDNLHTDEIIELARRGHLKQRLTALTSVAHERMKQAAVDLPCKPDDLSVILFGRKC